MTNVFVHTQNALGRKINIFLTRMKICLDEKQHLKKDKTILLSEKQFIAFRNSTAFWNHWGMGMPPSLYLRILPLLLERMGTLKKASDKG